MNAKATLRATFRTRRDALRATPAVHQTQDALTRNLARLLDVAPALFPRAQVAPRVASYLAFGTEWDPNAAAEPSWLFPRVAKGRSLLWFEIGEKARRERLVSNRYGILEAPPEECRACDATPQAPWIVIVPALACDTRYVRLGYGGGFYDRFLAGSAPGEARPGLLTVCLVPSAFLVEALPGESHDVPVDVIVTDEGVFLRSSPPG